MATDISQRIRISYPGFSKGQKKIANAILNDYDKVAYMTAAKLGKYVGDLPMNSILRAIRNFSVLFRSLSELN